VNEGYVDLSWGQVAGAAVLLLLNGAISVALRLGLGWQLLLAGVRTVVQLALVGVVLRWVFAMPGWPPVLGLVGVMTLVAGIAAVRRTGHRFPGVWQSGVVAVWVSSWAVGTAALVAVVRVEPWYRAQYAIPLMGMILGNTLSGISLALDRFTGVLDARRDEVEGLLALGATRWEAALPAVRESVRTGMIPMINAMTVVGIVSLPGMMTGQILAGQPPTEAAKYQIVILFLIASGTALGTVIAVLLSYRRLFNARHQFLAGRLRAVRGTK
jgi:putative ABC transport system permease protein